MYAKHIPMHRRRLAAGLVGLVVLVGSAVSQQAFAQSIDYDADNDNLIEVRSLEQLNAIRYDLDGDGDVTQSNMSNYADAFPTPATSMGCLATCKGYELMADLDFDTSGDDEITTADGVLSWGSGLGWEPIGTNANRFTAEFHGNGHTISHLFINRPGTDFVGLFGYVGSGAVIRSVGLVGVDVTGDDVVGGLVGRNNGTIEVSYATGEVRGGFFVGGLVGFNVGTGTIRASYATGVVSGDRNIGGLVGENFGTIHASYATGEVNGSTDQVGGLVGFNVGPGTIRASYATGEVNGNDQVGGLVGWSFGTIRASYATGEVNGTDQVGGLVGLNGGAVIDSYFDTDTSGLTGSEGRATGELQLPTTYTGIYANWNVDLDDADSDSNALTGGDDPWHFGASDQYPVLQVDFDGDGVKSWQEFGPHSRRVAVSPGVLSLMEGEAGTYTVVLLTTPTNSVTVTPMSDNPAVSVSGELTFSVQDWNVEQTVAVRAVNDDNDVDEVVSLTHTVESEDLNYASATAPVVTVNVADPDIDYDADNDNLIEVDSLAKLNAIRYDLDGNGTPTPSNMSAYAVAFPTPATPMCNTTCTGYELTADLDFDTSGDDEITTADGVLSWGSGSGWEPIGTNANNFTAEFHGNDHTISHLFINRAGTDYVGLFGYVGSGAVIRSVGLVGVDVTGDVNVGGLVGNNNGGLIRASYATGEVRGKRFAGGLVGTNSAGAIHASYATGRVRGGGALDIGGLVGWNNSGGTIRASYATGEVNGNFIVGGLVGSNHGGTIRASYATGVVRGDGNVGGLVGLTIGGTIRASYATGEVNSGGSNVGGLVGSNTGMVIDSYFDTNTSGLMGSEGRATGELQLPTTYTGIYANWNVDLDDADSDSNALTGGDDPWHFGTSEQYPVLQVDFNGDGVKSWQEFGPQSRPGVFVSPGVLSLIEGEAGTYTVVLLTTPTDSVTMMPMSDNPAVSVSDELTFSMQDWNVEQTVAVRAVNDDNVVDEVVSLTHTVESEDLNYALVTTPVVTVNVADPDIDYDADNDNLIEVRSLEQLNAIRYDLDGDGYVTQSNMSNYADAFPYPATSMGCLATCKGYELMADLDFDTSGDDEITTADGVLSWGSGLGWEPIGTNGNRFTAEFHGNGHTISHLFINRPGTDYVGLFSYVGSGAVIRSVGLVGVDVTGDELVGGLAASNSGGTINASYATGEVSGDESVGGLVGDNTGIINASYATGEVSGNRDVGGLVGFNNGTIHASYATGEVNGSSNGVNGVGGLVGENQGTIRASYATGEVNGSNLDVGGLVGLNIGGTIRASYATGEVSGTGNVGGLVGFNGGTGTIRASYATGEVNGNDQVGGLVGWNNGGAIRASYATGEVSGNYNVGGLVGFNTGMSIDSYFDTDTSGLTGSEGRATDELQSPTTYTGIYANWNVNLDDADSDSNALTGGDDPWHFGTSEQYPVLQVDFDGDGVKSWQEFGPNSRRVAVSPGVLSLMEGEAGTYTVVLLTTPTDSVTVTPMSDNPAVSVSGELTFSMQDWNMEQTVAVRAVNDANGVGEEVSLSHAVISDDPNYMSVISPVVIVQTTDDDIAPPMIIGISDVSMETDAAAGTEVSRFTVSDEDDTPEQLSTFMITLGGESASLFVVTPTTGTAQTEFVITLARVLARAPGHDLTLTVTANDGVRDSEEAELTVMVANLPPTALIAAPTTSSLVTGQVIMLDASGSTDTHTGGRIAGYEWRVFAGDARGDELLSTTNTATTEFTAPLELMDAQTEYVIALTVTDNNDASSSETTALTVYTVDLVNGEATELAGSVNENAVTGTGTGLTVSAQRSDGHRLDVASWSLSSTNSAPFMISSVGEVTVAGELDHETSGMFIFNVTAMLSTNTDLVFAAGAESRSEEVEVTIGDVDEPLTIIDTDDGDNTIAENADTDTVVANLALLTDDPDSKDDVMSLTIGEVTAERSTETITGLFGISTSSVTGGNITATLSLLAVDRLDRETVESYEVTIEAESMSEVVTATFLVLVTDVNDSAPVITFIPEDEENPGDGASGTLLDDVSSGTNVVRFTVTDADPDDVDSTAFRTNIVSMPASNLFAIVEDTGAVLSETVDAAYRLVVNTEGGLSAYLDEPPIEIVIQVRDVADNVGDAIYLATIERSSPAGIRVRIRVFLEGPLR